MDFKETFCLFYSRKVLKLQCSDDNMKKILPSLVAATSLICLSSLETTAQTFPFDGLVSYWDFNETSGTRVLDSTDTYNATLQNGAHFISEGFIGGGLYSGDVATSRMRTHLSDVVFQSYTFNMWVKLSTANDNNNYLIVGGPGSGLSGTISAAFAPDHTLYFNNANSGFRWTDSSWKMLTFENNSGVGSVYVDGNLVYSGAVSPTLSGSGDLDFFGPWDDVPRSLNGVADELGFWNRPLNQDEISTIYNNGTGLTISEPSSLALLGLSGLTGLMYYFRRKSK